MISIVKIAGVSLVAAAVSIVIKQLRPEFGIYIPLTAAAVIFIYAVSELCGLIEQLAEKLSEYGLSNEYMAVLVKSLGIAYTTQLAADVCRDAGETAIASKVEVCGKIMILSCALPVMLSVLNMIDEVISLI